MEVVEVRISQLAYAQEIAASSRVLSAWWLVLNKLAEHGVVELDEERKPKHAAPLPKRGRPRARSHPVHSAA